MVRESAARWTEFLSISCANLDSGNDGSWPPETVQRSMVIRLYDGKQFSSGYSILFRWFLLHRGSILWRECPIFRRRARHRARHQARFTARRRARFRARRRARFTARHRAKYTARFRAGFRYGCQTKPVHDALGQSTRKVELPVGTSKPKNEMEKPPFHNNIPSICYSFRRQIAAGKIDLPAKKRRIILGRKERLAEDRVSSLANSH